MYAEGIIAQPTTIVSKTIYMHVYWMKQKYRRLENASKPGVRMHANQAYKCIKTRLKYALKTKLLILYYGLQEMIDEVIIELAIRQLPHNVQITILS